MNFREKGVLCALLCAAPAFVLAAKPALPGKKRQNIPAQSVEQALQKKTTPPKRDARTAGTEARTQNELEAANALFRAELEQKLSSLVAEIEHLRLDKERKRLLHEIEEAETRQAHEASIRALQMQKERLLAEWELAQAAFNKQMAAESIQIATLDRKALLQKAQAQLLQETKNRIQAEVAQLQVQAEREKHLTPRPVYRKDPLRKKDNVLVLSDRRIELDAAITPWKASYIIDQIQYFNNKEQTHPIFLVIDSCLGGSIDAGCAILQAMKHSKAPVYVVVKQYAVSMAAILTTLATKSYAYPNARICHHQPASFTASRQNLRERKEAYEGLAAVWERLGGAVAKKMGISLKEFEKKLYKKSMHGNWEEYGTDAQKLKWVDQIIDGIDDTALSTLPAPGDYTCQRYMQKVYGIQPGQTTSPEEEAYYAMATHDCNYSYHPAQQRSLGRQPSTP